MASHNQSLIQSVFMLQSPPVTLPLYHLQPHHLQATMLVAYQNSTYQSTLEIPYCGSHFGIVLMQQSIRIQC